MSAVAEAAVAVTAGVIAASIALVGFGLDSVIEFFAAAIVVWQLRGQGEEREIRAIGEGHGVRGAVGRRRPWSAAPRRVGRYVTDDRGVTV
jgi:hypothetical protein